MRREDEEREDDRRKNIFYLCNGEVKECEKTNCYKHGGLCRHTRDIKFAENFQKYGEVFQEIRVEKA